MNCELSLLPPLSRQLLRPVLVFTVDGFPNPSTQSGYFPGWIWFVYRISTMGKDVSQDTRQERKISSQLVHGGSSSLERQRGLNPISQHTTDITWARWPAQLQANVFNRPTVIRSSNRATVIHNSTFLPYGDGQAELWWMACLIQRYARETVTHFSSNDLLHVE